MNKYILDSQGKSTGVKHDFDCDKFAFAMEYAIDKDAQRAAIAVGYTPSTARVKAYELLKDAEVKAFLEEYDKQHGTSIILTADMVAKKLWSIACVCSDHNSPEFSPKAAVTALSELAKRTGGFTAKLELSGGVDNMDMAKKTPEELREFIRKFEEARNGGPAVV